MWPASVVVIGGLAALLVSVGLELGQLTLVVSLIVTAIGCVGFLANLRS